MKKILGQIVPSNYRLEIIENIYSLIFMSSNDLKESDDEEDEDGNDEKRDDQDMSDEENGPNEERLAGSNGREGLESFEILSEEGLNLDPKVPQLKINDEQEYSIYDIADRGGSKQQHQSAANNSHLQNHSSKSTLGSYSSYVSNESQHYYRKFSSGHVVANSTGTTNEEDEYVLSRKNKTNIYR